MKGLEQKSKEHKTDKVHKKRLVTIGKPYKEYEEFCTR